MSSKKINIEDATDFINGGDLSDLSEDLSNLSDLSEKSDFEELPGTHFTDDEDVSLEDEEDDVPISSIQNEKQRNEDLGGDELDDNQNSDATPSKKHKFRWRKKDTLVKSYNFVQPFTEPPFPEMTPYFRKFVADEIITDVVEQTNLYSYQKKQKNIMTTEEEIRLLIGVMIKMGIVSLPSYKCYWSQQLRYSPVADVMSLNRFQLLLENLHFVNNDEIDKNDKLAKIRPIVDIVRNQCIEVEPEEYHSVDEQSYHLKQNFQVYDNIIQKSLKNRGLRSWSMLGLPELCTIFSFMKENQRQIMEMPTLIMTIYKNQHKLLPSYVRIFLAIKIMNCFSIIGFLL